MDKEQVRQAKVQTDIDALTKRVADLETLTKRVADLELAAKQEQERVAREQERVARERAAPPKSEFWGKKKAAGA